MTIELEVAFNTPATDSKTAYLANREAWKQLARDKANGPDAYIRYIITQAIYLSEKIGSEKANAWALGKLRAGFTSSSKHGRRTLKQLLNYTKDPYGSYGRPFDWVGPVRSVNGVWPDAVVTFCALATYLYDEIRMEEKA